MIVKALATVLVNINDEEMKDGEKPLTMKRLIMNALGSGVASDQSASAKDKEHCFDLMMQVKSAGDEIELDVEDVGIIKNRIAQLYAPLISGQASKLIEGKPLVSFAEAPAGRDAPLEPLM